VLSAYCLVLSKKGTVGKYLTEERGDRP